MSILKYERKTPKSMQKMYEYLIDYKKTDSTCVFGIGVNPAHAVTEMEFVQNLYQRNNICHPYIQAIFAFDVGIQRPLQEIRDICMAVGYCLIDDERQVFGAIHYKKTDKVHCHYIINYVGINGMLYRQRYSIFHYIGKVNEILSYYGLNRIPVYESGASARICI